MTERGRTSTRSRAESWNKLEKVRVGGKITTKSGYFVGDAAPVSFDAPEQYVSRAGLGLASVAETLGVDFRESVVLDVGSSTGGFTDYALQHGARKVVAVDVGTDQLHPTLRNNAYIELHEKTDIRDFIPSETIGIIVIDVSFISLREILPHVGKMSSNNTQNIAMGKPQFVAVKQQKHKGLIKNEEVRRSNLQELEVCEKH